MVRSHTNQVPGSLFIFTIHGNQVAHNFGLFLPSCMYRKDWRWGIQPSYQDQLILDAMKLQANNWPKVQKSLIVNLNMTLPIVREAQLSKDLSAFSRCCTWRLRLLIKVMAQEQVR